MSTPASTHSSQSSKSFLRRRLSSLKSSLSNSVSKPREQSQSQAQSSAASNTQISQPVPQIQELNINAKMGLPETYKHAVFKEAGKPLVLESVTLQLPKAGEVLVKVEACGVCYSDMYAQHNGMGGGFPMVPGHEVIGRVAAVGDGVEGFKEGDRIGAGWHGGHDGTCQGCQKGLFQMCAAPVINGETKEGGYAEYVRIQAKAAVRVPDHVDAAQYAPVLCAGVTAFNAIRNMNIPVGETIAIKGLGGVGHMAIQYANRLGYRVVAMSRDGSKEKLARELGAHDYVDGSKGDEAEQLQKLGGARLIIVTSPTADAAGPLLGGLGVLGKLLFLSVPGEITVNTFHMLGKGLSVQCWPGGHNGDSEDAIAFTERHNIECKVEKYPLSKAVEAYDAMLAGKITGKAVLVME